MILFNLFDYYIKIYLLLTDRAVDVTRFLDSDFTIEQILEIENQRIQNPEGHLDTCNTDDEMNEFDELDKMLNDIPKENSIDEETDNAIRAMLQDNFQIEELPSLPSLQELTEELPPPLQELTDELPPPLQELIEELPQRMQEEEELEYIQLAEFFREEKKKEKELKRKAQQDEERKQEEIKKMKREEKKRKTNFYSIRKDFFNSMTLEDIQEAGPSNYNAGQQEEITTPDQSNSPTEEITTPDPANSSTTEQEITTQLNEVSYCPPIIEPNVDVRKWRKLSKNKKYKVYKIEENVVWLWNLEESCIFLIQLPANVQVPTENAIYLIRIDNKILFTP